MFSFRKPSFGFRHPDPVIEIIERVKIAFSEGKSDGLFGKGSFYGQKELSGYLMA